jgi:preprotein translocase subunit SecA
MRIFGSEKLATMMGALGLPEDTPIENRMVSKSLESAQKKVEGHNFDTRKHLVEYDDVMNQHREIIYARRRRILKQDSLKEDIIPLFEAEFEALMEAHTDLQTQIIDIDKLAEAVRDVIPLPKNWESGVERRDKASMLEEFMKITKEVYRAREMEFGDEGVMVIERLVSLKTIDTAWLEHLEAMDHLRDGIGLRGYGQRDPLVEYKAEAYRMFGILSRRIDSEIVHMLFKVRVDIANRPQDETIETEITQGAQRAVTSAPSEGGQASKQKALREAERSGRESGPIRRTAVQKSKKKSKKKKKRR